MTESTKQKTKLKTLELVFSYIVPIVLVATKYDLLVKSEPEIKLTGMAIILALVLGVRFYGNLMKFISTIKNVKARKTINIVKNVLFALVLILLLELSKNNIANLEFIIVSCSISISVGNLFKEDYYELQKADEKEERQNEIIEAFNKANGKTE